MPFLRAALLKKKPAEPEQEEILQPPVVIVEEQNESEEVFEPEKFEELHRILDERDEEAEVQELEPVVFVEVETIVDEVPEPVIEVIEAEQAVEPLIEEEEEPEENSEPELVEPELVVDEVLPEIEAAESELAETEDAEDAEKEEIFTELEQLDEESNEAEEVITETETEPEPEQNDDETVSDFDENSLLDETPEPEPELPVSHKDYSGSQLDYDFTSGERYVDKVSTKTEFDKMLDELAAISKDLLSWQTEKFARQYTDKFQEGGESSVADARKCEAFLGGYITNAAMLLYDMGYRDIAIKQLEQAVSILKARMKLEDETSAIKSRVEEQNDSVDLSDILGLFGDG